MRQLRKVEKKWFEGCSAQMTHLPMARASAEVVATCVQGGRARSGDTVSQGCQLLLRNR